jgi:hypothetical protein
MNALSGMGESLMKSLVLVPGLLCNEGHPSRSLRPFVSLRFVLVVETEGELYLAGGIGICRRVSAEACSIGDGAIGLLKVCGVEDVEGFDTELQFAVFGHEQYEWQCSEEHRSRVADDELEG